MERKYEFTGLDRKINAAGRGVVVSQIRAVRSFGSVKKGETGGWIGMEYNLSHNENAWVKDNAVVIDDSVVCGNAVVSGNALIEESSEISGNAVVCGNARVTAAKISGNSRVSGYAEIDPGAEITDNAIVCDDASIEFDTCVCGDARVCGYGHVPAYTGVGSNIIVNKASRFEAGYGNKAADKLNQDAVYINYLRYIVNYWIFAGLPPYGVEKKDFLLLGPQASKAYERLKAGLEDLGLSLNPGKVVKIDRDSVFDFLGGKVCRQWVHLADKSMKKQKKAVKAICKSVGIGEKT